MNPIESRRWDAVRSRDAQSTFIFGVRTTRIACRPGCPARTPRPENVRFFDDFSAAREAGFRPCKRCAPDDAQPSAERQATIARACALLDADESLPLDAVAAQVGLSRFHFSRVFRAMLGVTPGAYRRARRAERLRVRLATSASVTTAIHEAGYGSPSRVYEAQALGMTPSSYRAGAPGERISYAFGDTSLGRVLVARTDRGICAIAIGTDDTTLLAEVRRDFPRAEIVADATAFGETLQSVLALVSGDGPAAEALALDVRGSAFRRRVWDALRAIPLGERRTYSEIAAAIGQPAAARAVASACAQNRLAIAIPCHRVVGSDGAMRGYRWGVERKASLLKRESRE